MSPTSESTSGTESRLSEVLSDCSSRVETQPLAGESGYFLLNTNNPAGQLEEEDVYSSVSSKRTANYPNIPSHSERAHSSTETSSGAQQLHPHLIMGEDLDPSEPSEQKRTSYENVSLPAASTRLNSGRPVSSYENVDHLRDSNSTSCATPSTVADSSSIPNATPSATTTEVEKGQVKRSAQQRMDAYEVMPLRRQIGSGTGGSGIQKGANAASTLSEAPDASTICPQTAVEGYSTNEGAARGTNGTADCVGGDSGRGEGQCEHVKNEVMTTKESDRHVLQERNPEGITDSVRSNGKHVHVQYCMGSLS